MIALLVSLFFFTPWFADNFGVVKLFASGVCCFILVACSGPKIVRPSPLWTPILLFLAAMVLSWWFSVDREMGLIGGFGQPYYGLSIALQCAIIFAIGVPLTELADWTVAALGSEGFICALNLNGWPVWAVVNHRAVGTIGQPAFLAAWVAVAGPLVWRSRYRWPGVFFTAFLLYATQGRGAALAIVLAAAVVWNWKAALVLVLFVPLTFTRAKRQSDVTRAVTWSVAARAGFEHPVLGWGTDAFSIVERASKMSRDAARMDTRNSAAASAHDDVLEVWATMGLVGLLAYGFLLWWIVKNCKGADPVLVVSLLSLFIQAKVNILPNAAMLWAAAVLSCVA